MARYTFKQRLCHESLFIFIYRSEIILLDDTFISSPGSIDHQNLLTKYQVNKEICSFYQYMVRILTKIIVTVHFLIDNRGLNKCSDI